MIFWFLLMIIIVGILICGIVMFFPFNLKGKSKKFSVIAVGGYSLCHLLFGYNMIYSMRSFKNISNPYIGTVMKFFAAVYFIILAYGALFLIIRKLVIWITGKMKNKKIFSIVSSKKIVAVIFILVFILGAAGYINAGIIKVKPYEISCEKKSDKEEYDIVMITDTHMGIGDSRVDVDTIVEKTNKITPDFIFLTGDIIDENTSEENAEYIFNAFSKMKSKYGIYAVLGNHESYREGDSSQLLKKYGITLLEDEAVMVNGVIIVGRKDYYNNPESLKAVSSKYKIDFSKPVIVLSHEPLEYEDLADYKVDLVLSGHTHGEQFPGTYSFVKMANDMVYGLKKYGNMNAIVSSGAGEWGLHYKFPSSNEILHIKLNME